MLPKTNIPDLEAIARTILSMNTALSPETIRKLTEIQQNSADFVVLQKFSLKNLELTLNVDRTLHTLMILDTETTGLDTETAKICQLGYVLVQYDPDTLKVSSTPFRTEVFLQDPGIPISSQATQKHSITDEMVKDKSIPLELFHSDLKSCHAIIAHNTSYDRKLLENSALLPELLAATWVDSLTDIDWAKINIPARNLETLAINYGFFYDAHGALDDASALYQILIESNLFSEAFESAQKPHSILFIPESPFEAKDILKDSGAYAVYDGKSFKGWKYNLDSLTSEELLEVFEKISGVIKKASLIQIPSEIRFSHAETKLFSLPSEWKLNQVPLEAIKSSLATSSLDSLDVAASQTTAPTETTPDEPAAVCQPVETKTLTTTRRRQSLL